MSISNERVKELEAKENLTGAEMEELISLKPGAFYMLPDGGMGRLTNFEQAIINQKESSIRSKHAMEQGCYLEVISLRLQHAEYFLRIFLIGKQKDVKIYDEKDKRTFGVIIDDCQRAGLNPQLVQELKDFNLNRINAIHKYLTGITNYEELRKVCEQSVDLVTNVSIYVAKEVGYSLS